MELRFADLRRLIFSFFIIAHYGYSIAVPDQRVKWIALGESIADMGGRTGVKIDTWNLSYPVSTVVEIGYGAKKGMKINWVVAAARKMNGFVSIEDGGLEERYVKIKYISENGIPDELYIFVESYKAEPLVLNDNVARTGNVAIVYNGIRNWTSEILRQVSSSIDI